jgi:hypothetical protein
VSDIDTEAVDSLKVLDPNRPIREATEQRKSSEVGSGPKSDVVISGPPSHLAELGNADRHEFLQVGEENDPFFADRIVERFARIERDFDAS